MVAGVTAISLLLTPMLLGFSQKYLILAESDSPTVSLSCFNWGPLGISRAEHYEILPDIVMCPGYIDNTS